MKNLSIFTFIFLTTISIVWAGPTLTPEDKASLEEDVKVIEGWVKSDDFIKAVKTQNALKVSLEEIKKRDGEWIKLKKEKKDNELMKACKAHALGQFLRNKKIESKGRYSEGFLCDNQGANIAVNKYTSDYWQGDESKWTDSFADGKGAVVYGKPKFDKSSKAMQVQISVPVMDGDKAIGVLVVGVKFSKIKAK